MNTKLTPKTANTHSKVCQLRRDNVETKNSWIMVHEAHVTISNQKKGEERTGVVKLSKREFNRFIKFYETGK